MIARARGGRWLAGVVTALVLGAAPARAATDLEALVRPVREALRGGDHDRAARLSRRAEAQVADVQPPTLAEVRALDQIANLYLAWGYYPDAESYFRKTATLAGQLGDPLVAVQVQIELGLLFLQKEDYARAARQWQRCQADLDGAGINAYQKMLLRGKLAINRGKLAEMAGQYGQAEKGYNDALEVLHSPYKNDKTAFMYRAHALNNLGWLYHRLGLDAESRGRAGEARARYEQAREFVEKAKDLRETYLTDRPEDIAQSLNNLGLVLFALNDMPGAETQLRKSLQTFQEIYGPDHPEVGTVANSLAALCQARGELDESRRLHEQAIAVLRKAKGKQHPDAAAAVGYFAWFHAAQGQWAEAAGEMDQTRQAFRYHIQRVLSSQSEAEQLAFLEKKDKRWLDAALSLGLKAGSDGRVAAQSAGWVLNGKGMTLQVLAARTVLARQSENSQVSELYKELRDVRDQMAARALRSFAASRQTEDNGQDLAAREDDLSHRLALALQSPIGEGLWADAAAVQNVLAHDPVLRGDAVLIDIARFRVVDFAAPRTELEGGEEHYAAWVVPPEGDVRVVDLGPAQVIDRAVADLRDELVAATPKDVGGRDTIATLGEGKSEALFREKSAALAKLLLGPMYGAIRGKQRWIVSPDGDLWLVPWSALVLPGGDGNGPYAVEEHTVSLVSSGRDLLASRPPKGTRGAPLILADPDFGEAPRGKAGLLTGFDRLGITSAEADEIRPFLERYTGREPTLLKRGEAEERAFRDARSPSAVVLSTHGFFLERGKGRPDNPLLRCGLALAHANEREGGSANAESARNDGLLLGLEILDTDLRGTDLVVLDACETALGSVRNGEGVADLQSAFQLAGGQTVVATLWKVPELQTALLMRDYFKALADHRLDKAAALRQAQLTRIKERRRGPKRAAHPFYWAAVNVTGQWAVTLGD